MPRAAELGQRAGLLIGGVLLAACTPITSISPSPSPSASPSPTTAASVGTPSPTAAGPSATPTLPPLSLDLPRRQDERIVRVDVDPQLSGDEGQIVVTVTNLTDRRVGELVLRWPTALRDTLFLAPFRPSQQRIAEGGPPLMQDWTKWVEGPGESGEPAGTTSLGWGPLLPGATLTIPIQVTRSVGGGLAFDLQVLADEAILSLPDGAPAELRTSVP